MKQEGPCHLSALSRRTTSNNAGHPDRRRPFVCSLWIPVISCNWHKGALEGSPFTHPDQCSAFMYEASGGRSREFSASGDLRVHNADTNGRRCGAPAVSNCDANPIPLARYELRTKRRQMCHLGRQRIHGL